VATARAAAAAAGLSNVHQPEAKAAERKLGTCGPPPRKNPQRQTSAEGMPPLPLPAVPLRRVPLILTDFRSEPFSVPAHRVVANDEFRA